MKKQIKKLFLPLIAVSVLLVAVIAAAIPTLAAEPVTPSSVSVSMDGSINLNFFYLNMGEADAVHITVKDADGSISSERTVAVKDLPINKKDGKDRYQVKVSLPAARMTSAVTVSAQKDGADLDGGYTYSVKQYADKLLANEDRAAYHAVVKAMLNYGAMAQKYFGINTYALANQGIYRNDTNPISAVTSIGCDDADYTKDLTTLSFTGAEAVLESVVGFRFYFTYTGDASELSATVVRAGISEASVAPRPAKDKNGEVIENKYYILINNVSPTLYNKQYTVTIKGATETLTAKASIFNYINAMINKADASVMQKNAVRAMYNHFLWTTSEEGARPAVTECKHTYVHEESADKDTATAYYCSSCGVEVKTVPDSVEFFKSPFDINTTYKENFSSVKTDEYGQVYAQLKGGSNGTGYNSLQYKDLTGIKGKYLVIKYRFPSDNGTKESVQRVYLKTPVAADYVPISYQVSYDDKWHTVVIDLSAYNNAITSDTTINTLWVRPIGNGYAAGGTEADSVDYAYIAICDDISDISALVDESTYEKHRSSSSKTEVTTATRECVGGCTPKASTAALTDGTMYEYKCTKCGEAKADSKFVSSDVSFFRSAAEIEAAYFPGMTSPIDYGVVKADPDGQVYAQLLGGAAQKNNDLKYTDLTGVKGRYFVIKYRLYAENTFKSPTQLLFFITSSTGTNYAAMRYTTHQDGEWHTAVIDLGAYNSAITSETEITTVLLRPIGTKDGEVGTANDRVDYAYIAVCDSLENVSKVVDQDTYRLHTANGTYVERNADGSCISGGCTLKEETVNNIFKSYCTACGKVYSQKDITAVNKFAGPQSMNAAGRLFFEDPTVMTEYNEETGKHESFARNIFSGSDSEGWLYLFGAQDAKVDISNTGNYLVMRMRTNDVYRFTINLKTGDNALAGADLISSELNDGWKTFVISLDKFTAYENNTNNTTFTLKLQIYRTGKNALHTVDIAYAAIVDSLSEAASLIGSGDISYMTDITKAADVYTLNSTPCQNSELGHKPNTTDCDTQSVCTVCSEILRASKAHMYDVKKAEKQYMVSSATDDTPAIYYYSCSCGEKGSETFTYGKTLEEFTDLSKSESYNNLAASIETGEKFLYFTDPHYVTASADGSIDFAYDNYINVMAKHFNASSASFVLSGGDWLNKDNTRENAIANLKEIDLRMRNAFGNKYYLVVGNHDTNYQGASKLTNDDIISAWYTDARYGGSSYYSFEGENTRFFVFDSGIDWNHESAMTDYDITQINWYISELMTNTAEHIALAPHMLYSATELHPGTKEILAVSEAFNNRTSIVFNGNTYDFSDATGKVEFLIAGHSHKDEVTYNNGIACILTQKNSHGNVYPIFDMIAVDYDKNVLYAYRVANEVSQREISLTEPAA